MPNSKVYTIKINGVEKALSDFDALLGKAEELARRLSSGMSVASPSGQTGQQQTQQAQQQATIQAEITGQIEQQTQALKEQTSIVTTQTGEYAEALQVAQSILGTYDANLVKLAEYDAALKRVNAQLKEAQKAGASPESMSALLAEQMRYKQLRSETLGIIKTETNLLQSQQGSYDQLNATVGRLRDALRASGGDLNEEQFKAISTAVDEIDKKLKDADKGMGQFFRNVGNYPSAAEGFRGLKIEVAGVEREFESARAAIMELKNAMAQLAVQGQTDSEEYKNLAAQMKNIQLAMVSVNDEIARSKDASSGLHDLIEMVQGFAAIGTVGQGIAGLFGFDDGAIGEQIKKMTELMGILQGLNELKNQMATGTGIGPTLNKLFEVTGLSSSFSALKDNLTEIGNRLGIIRVQTETASAGMGNLSLAMKTASNAAAFLGKSLAAALATTGVIWVISEMIDALRSLGKEIYNMISLTDDYERSNKALKETIDILSDSMQRYIDNIDRSVMTKRISEAEGYAQKMDVIKTTMQEYAEIYSQVGTLVDKHSIFGGKYVTPALQDWSKLGDEIASVQAKLASGKDVRYTTVLGKGLGDIIKQWELVDKTNMEAMTNWAVRIKEGANYQWVLTNAVASTNDEVKNTGIQVTTLVDGIYNAAQAGIALRNSLAAAAAKVREEVAAIDKYGRNWQSGLNLDKHIKELDTLRQQGQITDGEYAKRRAEYENEYRRSVDKTTSALASANRRRVNDARRTANELSSIEKSIQADKLAAMRDGLTKTIATMEEERRRRLDEIDKMSAAESKKNEARAAANRRYDIAEAEARRKWRMEYIKAEEDFTNEVAKQRRELEKQEIEYAASASVMSINAQTAMVGSEQAKNLMEPYYEQARKLGELENYITKKRIETMRSLTADLDRVGQMRAMIANGGEEALEEYGKEYEALQKRVEAESSLVAGLISQYSDVMRASQELQGKIDKEGVAADSPTKRFDEWNEYYRKLYEMRVAYGDNEIQYQKRLNDIEAEEQVEALAAQLLNEQRALTERHEALSADTEALKQAGLTKEQEQTRYEERMFEIETLYRSRQSEVIAAAEQKNLELEKKSAEETVRIRTDMYSSIINETEKFYNASENRRSRLRNENTDSWGFFNIKKFRKERDEIMSEQSKVLDAVSFNMQQLRQDLSAGTISLGDFNTAYSDLDELKQKVKDTMKEISSDNGMEDFVKGIDTWVQAVGQAATQIISSIFDVRSSELDRLQEELDKQLEVVQKKYDEMEELAQKHKDNMNEIEDELSTARGDRRQHLIDALSTEIDAQRRALSEQQKAEREKEKIEKRSDKLELQRKKEQKRQSLITAVINAAMAISQAAANKWPVPAIPLMALATAVGAAQVAAISSQHYANGGLLQGPTHAQGGIKVTPNVEVEGGEYVTNRSTTRKNLALLEYINSRRRKIDIEDMMEFFSGAPVSVRQTARSRFADGGMLPSMELAARRTADIVVERDDRPIVVSVQEINDVQQRVRTVRALAGIEDNG